MTAFFKVEAGLTAVVNTMGWNERSDPDMRTANFCDVYREGVY